jgi:hypothetical protein
MSETKAKKSKAKKKSIKISVQEPGKVGESMWAEDLGNNRAKVDNIPVFTHRFTLDDVIEIDDNHEFVRVIERANRGGVLVYDTKGLSEDALRKRYRAIYDHFEKKNGIKVEGMFAGVAGIAIPLDMTLEEIERIERESPEKVELNLFENDAYDDGNRV